MTDTTTGSPLRQRMIQDMAARKLNRHTQRSHISSCKRFAAWLKRSRTREQAVPNSNRPRIEDPDTGAAGCACAAEKRDEFAPSHEDSP
jgi:hypothetical protein